MFAPADAPRRAALFEVIFESRTRAGRIFDLVLIAAILLSVAVVILASVSTIAEAHGLLLHRLEWVFTVLFTVEYLVRLSVVARPRYYARSFFGIIDFLAFAPSYLSLFVPGAQALLVIRIIRILRIFHVLDLELYESAGQKLLAALRSARYPITVFLLALVSSTIFLGTLLYVVEGEQAGISSIPVGIYWAVVTLTTLGYGDIVPVTALGRAITSGVVVLGYWMLAIPVGIIVTEMAWAARRRNEKQAAGDAGEDGADVAAAGDAAGDAAGEATGEAPKAGDAAPTAAAADTGDAAATAGTATADTGDAAADLRCGTCGAGGHAADAAYCRRCGAFLGARKQ